MFTAILTTHEIVVTLFLLHYLFKLILLLNNRNEFLAKYTKDTRVLEMIVSVLFLVTGVWMMCFGAHFNHLLIIKLACVFAAIPIAIIGFRRSNKPLAALSVFLILTAYCLAEMNRKAKTGGKIDTSITSSPIVAGKIIYTNTCANCHGGDGKMGGSGAKDLSASTLTDEQKRDLIRNGKNAMPAYKDLTDEQVNDVIQYVNTLKQ